MPNPYPQSERREAMLYQSFQSLQAIYDLLCERDDPEMRNLAELIGLIRFNLLEATDCCWIDELPRK